MEHEYKVCLDYYIKKVSKMNRIAMMNELGLSSDEMQEMILGGNVSSVVKARFDRIWGSMEPDSKLDYYYHCKEEEG